MNTKRRTVATIVLVGAEVGDYVTTGIIERGEGGRGFVGYFEGGCWNDGDEKKSFKTLGKALKALSAEVIDLVNS